MAVREAHGRASGHGARRRTRSTGEHEAAALNGRGRQVGGEEKTTHNGTMGGVAERECELGFDEIRPLLFVCTNLKHWKMDIKSE